MSNSNAAMPAVRLTVASIEGNTGEYLSHEFLRTVNGVFDEMLSRLYHGAVKRKGWATAEPWKELTEHECRTCIRDSLAKGNLVDAMNYLMFAHLNGHKLPTLCAPYSVDSQMRDQLAKALGVAGRSWDEMLDTASKWAKIAAKAESISETLKTAYEKEKLIEKIALELKLDPEAPADTIISTVHFLVKRCQSAVTEVSITGCTDPDVMENVAKMIKANNQPAAFAWDGRKVGTSPAMAAPYGVKASKKRQQYELTMEADDSGIPSPLFIFRSKKDRDDYLPLLRTFLGALEQAAYGKGRERHANDLPFVEQPILTMARMLDSDAGLAQQVIKKTVEARSLPTKQARINELRGTLVYAAAMILFEEMYGKPDAKPSSTSRSVVRVKISDLQPGMVIRFDRDYIAVVEGLIGTQIGDDGKINFWWSVRRERGGIPSKGVVFGSDITFNVDNDPDELDRDCI
ncbi:hypothetical protein [Klebsiella pneumoniae]|uniref:hypothetical protein n=1 Tax=Klebsiella pneumoniae TaxID=573 RepID=UPI0025A19C83|nr:hypothetical protein [Klebsiella pneumoniae]